MFRSNGSDVSHAPLPWQADTADWTPSGLNRWLGPALAVVNDRPNAANIGLAQRDLTVHEYVSTMCALKAIAFALRFARGRSYGVGQ